VLEARLGLTERDRRRLARGKTVVRARDAIDGRSVTIVGVVEVAASPAQLLSFTSRPEQLAASEYTREAGFIEVARDATDLGALQVQKKDIKAVRSCRPGRCHMKLPAGLIADLSALDRDDRRFADTVTVTILGWLGAYLETYHAGGVQSLVTYGDKKAPQSAGDASTVLLRESEMLREYAPALYDHLVRPPSHSQADVEDRYFWMIEDFGMRPLTTVTRSARYRPRHTDMDQTWVALQLLYASHYLLGSLRLVWIIENPQADEQPRSLVIWTDRVMFDNRVGGIKRSLVTRHLKHNVAGRLRMLQEGVRRGTELASRD
jgi:hypothetical protein